MKKKILFASLKVFNAALSGVLLTFAYPPGVLFFFAWFALVPVLIVTFISKKIETFLYGTITGVVFYSMTFQWTYAFHPYALIACAMVSGILFVGLPIFLISFLPRKNFMTLLAAPAIWIIFEYIKQNWLLAYPFGILGYTQYSWLYYIQIAELGGVFLVSWLIIFVNLIITNLGLHLFIKTPFRQKLKPLRTCALLLFLAFILPCAYSLMRLHSLHYEPTPRLKVGFAQTLFHPRKVWIENQTKYLKTIKDFISNLAGLKVQLILFPELTIDRFLSLEPDANLKDNKEILNGLAADCKEKQTNILIGCLEAKREEQTTRKFNSMLLFNAQGDLTGLYRKRQRVPFGEADPSDGFIPGLKEYILSTTAAIVLDIGPQPNLLTIEDNQHNTLKFGALICFESGFPQLARDYALKGADFLVNATNDYWSLSSVAMYQHAIMSVFRAIETRKPILRISNGGISCYIDERGKYVTNIPIFQQGAMTSQLYLLKQRITTLYTFCGDWPVLLSLVLLSFMVGYAFYKKLKKPI